MNKNIKEIKEKKIKVSRCSMCFTTNSIYFSLGMGQEEYNIGARKYKFCSNICLLKGFQRKYNV